MKPDFPEIGPLFCFLSSDPYPSRAAQGAGPSSDGTGCGGLFRLVPHQGPRAWQQG